MNVFRKKKTAGQYSVLEDNYRPASLPSYGQAINTFITSSYTLADPQELEMRYKACETELEGVLATCDRHSTGCECDQYIEGQMDHLLALHMAEVATHEHQAKRIVAARNTRAKTLHREIAAVEERRASLVEEIEPLRGLRAQFQLRLGSRRLSLGLPITLVAMVVDAMVNFSFLQTILLSNALLLLITVFCLSLMSDGSMWALATYLSRKEEKFISRGIYYTICGSLLSMFLLSVVTSIMIRAGSMGTVFATVNAAGQFIPMDNTFTLAQYGVTLVTSFVTTATGILSFAFSLDRNAHRVKIRDQLEAQLKLCDARLLLLSAELLDLESAPDPRELDLADREAAEQHMEALRVNLKLHLHKLASLQQKDATFTEKLAASAAQLVGSSDGSLTALPVEINIAS